MAEQHQPKKVDIDSDNAERFMQMAADLDMSFTSLINTLLRNIKLVKQETAIEMRQPEIQSQTKRITVIKKTNWAKRW